MSDPQSPGAHDPRVQEPPHSDAGDLDPGVEARVRASFARQSMPRTLGATMVEVSPGRVALEMPRDARFGQQFGYTHAGALTTLADTACGYAALTRMAADREVLTVDFTANFLAPAAGGCFRATGTVLRVGRTVVITRGEVHALDGAGSARLIAVMQAAMMAVALPPAAPDVPAA